MRILEIAVERGINFRVIIVDSRPQQHGLRSARRLLALNVKCTYVLINAVPFIISEVCILFHRINLIEYFIC